MLACIHQGLIHLHRLYTFYSLDHLTLSRTKPFERLFNIFRYRSFLQVAIEVPYILVQTVIYVVITYPAIGYFWSPYKFFWYFYATFCTFLYYVYLGMLILSVSENVELASVLATAAYTILNLFSGFLMPGPVNLANLNILY